MILEWFNRISVYNKAVLFDAIESRRNNQALVTVSNHRSCIDDPVLFGNYQTFCYTLLSQQIHHIAKFSFELMVISRTQLFVTIAQSSR